MIGNNSAVNCSYQAATDVVEHSGTIVAAAAAARSKKNLAIEEATVLRLLGMGMAVMYQQYAAVTMVGYKIAGGVD